MTDVGPGTQPEPRNERQPSLFSDREVYGGGDNPHGYSYRARVEKRVKRGREQFRFVGEQKFMSWRDAGPGFGPKRSRWFKTAEQAVNEANRWLDEKEYNPRSHAEGYA